MAAIVPREDLPSGRRLPPDGARSVNGHMSHFLVAIVCAAGLAGASEEPLADLRLVVEARPTDFTYRWQPSGAGTRTGEDTCDSSWAVGTGLRWGFGSPGSQHQFVLGAEALLVRDVYQSGGAQAGVLRAEIGYDRTIDERWQVLTGLVAGGGPGSFDRPGGISGDGQMTGLRSEFGLHAGVRWAATRRWAIGCEAGWLESRERYHDDDGSLELKRGGAWIGIAVSWVLDASPRRIDR